MDVDLLGPEPIYLQIAAVIRARIESGEYPPQRRIPSEADMCDEFEVSRDTVRAAVRHLRDEEGLLRTVMGRGTFVVKPE